MTKRDYFLLFVLGLLIALIPAQYQHSPGYMDADYYFLGGYNLVSGAGFEEQVLWNYLGDPDQLPNPSHGYWMPLASLVAVLGMWLSPGEWAIPLEGFSAARRGFIFFAGLLPPLTAWLTTTLGGNRRQGWFAGLLATFSGFYLAFLPTTDTFGLYMVLGALFLQTAWTYTRLSTREGRPWRSVFVPFGLGLLAGAMHLARADGLLWLGVAVVVPAYGLWLVRRDPARGPTQGYQNILIVVLLIIGGYLVVMGPWIIRNLGVFGRPLAPGGLRTLWLVRYDELFIYPPELLSFGHWWAAGLASIIQVRIGALWTNLGTALAVQGMIFVAPLAVAGLWRLRHDIRVGLGVLAWLGTFLAMTLIFPEPGARGGFFHSGAAIQVLVWAAAPIGLEDLIVRVGKTRSWRIHQAAVVFQVGFVVLAVGMTALLAFQRVIGQADTGVWNASAERYAEIYPAVRDLGGGHEEVVLVNNPPGYHLITGQPAVVIPLGDVETLLAVSQRYGASYLILEPNHPQPLDGLFENPENGAGLSYLDTVSETHIFRIE